MGLGGLEGAIGGIVDIALRAAAIEGGTVRRSQGPVVLEAGDQVGIGDIGLSERGQVDDALGQKGFGRGLGQAPATISAPFGKAGRSLRSRTWKVGFTGRVIVSTLKPDWSIKWI